MAKEPVVQQEDVEEEREFARSPMSAVLGAPLSWVALFGALTAVGSLIPVFMYPQGGGYASLSNVVLFGVTGLILGPWAGLVAGLIGGVIGMFIAPGAFPMGPVDVVFAAALIVFCAGLMARRWRWVALVWWIISLAVIYVFPYRWPGEAGEFAPPPEPEYLLSYWFVYLGLALWLAWVLTPLGKWVHRGQATFKQIVGLSLVAYIAVTLEYSAYGPPYSYLLRWPPELTITGNLTSAPLYLATGVIQGIITFALFRALWRTGLRRVPGSLLDESAGEA
jgi:hypothetical protein